MRKKYLSALLFGALLFASAGTFTSCKDYDDDINNLQEQINTINTTLADLKAQIGDKGVSSVTFDETTGVLTVVDADGTHTYTIKTTAGEVADVKITIEGQELKVNGETIGKVGDTVAVANGELTINGTATGIKVGEYAILDNQTTGTVTITLPDADGKMQTVELMKASAALTAVEIENSYAANFNAFGEFYEPTDNSWYSTNILWQKSQKSNPNWKGSKGAVEKNQLLIGQINYVNVQVTPATYALDEQALNLVDSRGNVAPVIVKATPNNRLMGVYSRSTSSNGSWTLSLEIDQTKVNTSNIRSVFDLDEDNRTSLGYALYVNGQPYTAYDLSVETANNEYTGTPIDGGYIDVTNGYRMFFMDANGREQSISEKLPVGTTNFYIKRADLYDFYLTFEKTNKSLAEQYGIQITEDGRGVIIPAGAEGVQITATVHTMGINGYVAPSNETTITNEVTLQIAGSEITSQTLPVTNHVISAANPLSTINVDFGDVFAQFPAAAREAVRSGNAVILVEGDTAKDGFFLNADKVWSSSKNLIDYINNSGSNAGANKRIKLYENDWTSWEFGIDDMLDLKYMQLDPSVTGALNPDAVPGEYNLTFRAVEWNGAVMGNELIKVTVPVTVSTPKFTDLFNFKGNWNDAKTEYTTKISINENQEPALLLGAAFEKKAEGALATEIQLLYDLINNKSPFVGGIEIVTDGTKYITTKADQLMTLNQDLIYNSTNTALQNSNLGVKAYYDLFINLNLGSAYDNLREAFAVTSDDLTVKLQRALEGITAAYYINGTATSTVQLLSGNEILAGSGTIGKDANGLIFSFDGNKVDVKYSNWHEITGTAGSFASNDATPEITANYKFMSLFSSKATKTNEIGVNFNDENNSVTFNWAGTVDKQDGLSSENVKVNWSGNVGSTNVVIEFNDATGMKYQMSPITLIKANN